MSAKGKTLPVKTIVQTSLLIALAVLVRNFSYMVYFGGAPGMRVGFSGVFTKITAILFGPFLGGTASGIVDVVGFMIKPEGAYMPMLTVTAILGGCISGVLWRITRDIDIVKLQRAVLILISILGVLGIINHIHISFFSHSYWAQIINRLGKYKDFATIGLEIVAIIGMFFIIVGVIVKRSHKQWEVHSVFLKVMMVTAFSGIFITTLNTYILQLFIPELGRMGFIVFWIPRVVQEVFMTVIQAYIVSLLLIIYRKNIIK